MAYTTRLPAQISNVFVGDKLKFIRDAVYNEAVRFRKKRTCVVIEGQFDYDGYVIVALACPLKDIHNTPIKRHFPYMGFKYCLVVGVDFLIEHCRKV